MNGSGWTRAAEAPSWVLPLREATEGRPQAGAEVVHGAAPGLLASDAVEALTSVLLTALVCAAAVLRSGLSAGQFDLIALLLRTASVAFVVRSAIALVRLLRRLARDRTAREHALAWSRAGCYERGPQGERWFAREELLGFALAEERTARGASVSTKPLWLVLRPARTPRYWELPPFYAAQPEILLARLERWRSSSAELTAERPAPELPPPPSSSPEERYSRAARGQLEAGEVVVPEGTGYRLRAPYGALLALVFVADALLQAGSQRERLLAPALVAAALVPAALALWFAWLRRRRAVRLGIALLLAPEELLVRGPHGVVSVPWSQLSAVELSLRQAWSPFVGSYLVRVLWFVAFDGTRVPFDGAFLGVPPEVVARLAQHFRSGLPD